MKETDSVARVLALAGVYLALLPGCTPADAPRPETSKAQTPPPLTAPPTSGPAVRREAATAAAAASQEKAKVEGGPEAPSPIPSALADLKAKIQPGGTSQAAGAAAKAAPQATSPSAGSKEPEKVDATAFLPAAEKLALDLATALDRGDIPAASGLCVSEEELGKVLNPGYKEILAGNLLPQNRATLETYGATLKGKGGTPTFKPGTVTKGPARGAFKEGFDIMSGAALVIDMNGVKVEVRLDQLVRLGDVWRIFRVGSP